MFTVPGKTFLVGEYAVLVKGEALGIATKPQFKLLPDEIKYHPESAVGLFCKKNNFSFHQKIENPYGVGGFGGSTAEFIFAWFEHCKLKNKSEEKINDSHLISEILNDYWDLFESDSLKNKKPSGADLVIQLLGQITYFNSDLQKSKSMIWPFPDLSFFVVSTGLKIQTHDHLENLNRETLHELPAFSKNVIDAFFENNQIHFLNHLKKWSEKLQLMHLQHVDVLQFKNDLMKNNEIIFVKPCGAMGADVCIVFFETRNKNNVHDFLMNQKIVIQSDNQNLCAGIFEQHNKSKGLI